MGASRKCPDMLGGRCGECKPSHPGLGPAGAAAELGTRRTAELSPLAAFKGLGARGGPRQLPLAPPLPRPPASGERGREQESGGQSPWAGAPPRHLTVSAGGSAWLRVPGPWKCGHRPEGAGEASR